MIDSTLSEIIPTILHFGNNGIVKFHDNNRNIVSDSIALSAQSIHDSE